MRRATASLALMALTAWTSDAIAAGPGAKSWRSLIEREDFRRLHDWRDAFVQALKEARAGGSGADIDREGDLLKPDASLDDVRLPDGRFRCRTIKLGSNGGQGLSYVAYPAFDCAITTDGAVRRFAKMNGSQRPVGYLFDDQTHRKIFLGTLMLSDERVSLNYGRDHERDMVAAVERVGSKRWRMVFPYPRYESTLDVIELVPVG